MLNTERHLATARDLFLPDAAGGAGDTSKAADMAATRTRTASSSGEAWLAVPADQIASRPGLYTLRLRGDGGAPTVEVAVVTPGPGTVLADKERDALAGLAKACCGEGSGKAPFCASM